VPLGEVTPRQRAHRVERYVSDAVVIAYEPVAVDKMFIETRGEATHLAGEIVGRLSPRARFLPMEQLKRCERRVEVRGAEKAPFPCLDLQTRVGWNEVIVLAGHVIEDA
jgi:hypothetical protein